MSQRKGRRRRGGSRKKKCKGKNNVAGEKDIKNWGREGRMERREMSENIYGGRENFENEEHKTKQKSKN
jgi:hypothetical protein